MGFSQADKAASHDRIVNVAADRMRRDGIHGISVAHLMTEAGLTHGGFYRHFGSRDDLVAEAVEAALAQGSERATKAAAPGGVRAIQAIIATYLSQDHRDQPETGCAVAGLAEDISRTDERTRAAYARQVKRYLAGLESLLAADGVEERVDALDSRPYLILSALVGALVVARAIGPSPLSDAFLDQTARALRSL